MWEAWGLCQFEAAEFVAEVDCPEVYWFVCGPRAEPTLSVLDVASAVFPVEADPCSRSRGGRNGNSFWAAASRREGDGRRGGTVGNSPNGRPTDPGVFPVLEVTSERSSTGVKGKALGRESCRSFSDSSAVRGVLSAFSVALACAFAAPGAIGGGITMCGNVVCLGGGPRFVAEAFSEDGAPVGTPGGIVTARCASEGTAK